MLADPPCGVCTWFGKHTISTTPKTTILTETKRKLRNVPNDFVRLHQHGDGAAVHWLCLVSDDCANLGLGFVLVGELGDLHNPIESAVPGQAQHTRQVLSHVSSRLQTTGTIVA